MDVLVLDDEAHILAAVKRALRSELGISVETTTDPYEALARLETDAPRVLITDFRMPGINGVQVLREARRTAPDTVRILLTAHADKDNVIEAVNSGKIFRYVAKPWDNEALAGIVREALAVHAAAQRRQRMRAAVDYVGDLQRTFLNTERLVVPEAEAAACFTPCEHASGDYVDALPLPGRRTALILGDVSGHGLGAALFVFTARALLRSGLAEGQPLEDVLVRTNRFLCRDMDAGRFLTLFVAIHDAAAETLTYVNSGHPPPCVLGRGGLTELTRTDLPLGIDDGQPFDNACTVPLRDGDLVFGCTDGLLEARNPARELFGPERLLAILREVGDRAPAEIIDRVRAAYHEFAGDGAAEDDLSLLAYRAAPRANPRAATPLALTTDS